MSPARPPSPRPSLTDCALQAEDDDDDFWGDEEEADEGDDSGDVVTLTADNFESELASVGAYLVEFYAPWCGHCKQLAPEYAKAATALKGNADLSVKLGAVDATVESDLAGQYDVQGYPTLKFFVDGEALEYGGGRTADDIVQWVTKKLGPALKELPTAADAKAFADASEVVVIGVFDNSAPQFATLESVARKTDDVNFGVSAAADVASEYGVSAPAIVLLKKFDEGKAIYDGDFSAESIESWVASKSLPLVIPFNDENAAKIFGGSIDNKFLAFVTDDASEAITAKLSEISKANQGAAVFATVAPEHEQVLEYFGLTSDMLPAYFMLNMDAESGSMKKYLHDGSIDELQSFLDAYAAGNVKPHLKSEPAPETEVENGLTTIVGSTFDRIALDESKDVIVEFYAPWCGHCKDLAPKYAKLAAKLADVESVVVAQFEATANDVPETAGVEVQGFPTIVFFPANDKANPITYEGDRTAKAIGKFIKKNASIAFELPKKTDSESQKEDL